MLHILLLVLKCIGIIIAAILGILVLLVCIVLFVPVRYELEGKSDGELSSVKGKLKVTWFLHLFRADVYYKEKRLRWRIRFAFYRRSSGAGTGKGEEQDEEEQKKNGEELDKEDEGVEEAPAVPEETKAVPQKLEESKETVEEAMEEPSEKVSSGGKEPEEDAEDPEGKGHWLLQKIQALYQKIKCTFQRVCARIKALKEQADALREKKDKLAAFVQDEVHRDAFTKARKALFWYLGKLKPKKAEIRVRYGFGDPYYTGQSLAVLGILYPFLGEYTEIVPDFEQRVLKGTLSVNGRVRVSHLAHFAWKLFREKNIRRSYKDMKNFKL